VPDLVTTPEDLPLDLEPRPAEANQSEVVIGTVSRIGPHKGIELIVRALPNLAHTTAVIVGEGPMLADIRALASSLGVADRVRTPGFDPNPRRWLATFDIFVLPTRAETALPLAVVEGMLAGLPVIATDLGSIAESFVDGGTGLLVPPDDLNALVGALRLLIEDAPLRKRMGVDGRAFALEHFGIVPMVEAYENLYREITSPADLDLRRA
jgi:glycosyltransferase involved in cell wall biosynthesis